MDDIKVPWWFDRKAFLKVFETMSTLELYKAFECNSATAFSNMMRKHFPNKPYGVAYGEYVRGLLSDPRLQQGDQVVKESVQPRVIFGSPEWKALGIVERAELAENDPEIKQAWLAKDKAKQEQPAAA